MRSKKLILMVLFISLILEKNRFEAYVGRFLWMEVMRC